MPQKMIGAIFGPTKMRGVFAIGLTFKDMFNMDHAPWHEDTDSSLKNQH